MTRKSRNGVKLNKQKIIESIQNLQNNNSVSAPIVERPKLHIAVVMMVKNEKKRLGVTLDSVKNFANSLVLYDTGSSDNTIEIATEFCNANNIPLRLKQGEFVDFSTSRNVALDFADTFEDIDYLLLMDTNDELRNGQELREFAEKFRDDKTKSCFLLCQQWWSGNLTKYYNVRFVKPRFGWRYKGVVHEYMHNENEDINRSNERVPDTVVLYQDRTQDDDKTKHRFSRDKVLLLAEYEKDPTEPRTVFYLAQTCACLDEKEEAYKYYEERTKLVGFWEEKYQALFCCGELSYSLKMPWETSLGWFMKAFETCNRAEPLVKIAEHYRQQKQFLMSYTFAKLACSLQYPNQCILFVNKRVYDYERWHLLGIVAYYVPEYEIGRDAVVKAIAACNAQLDHHNLKCYDDRLNEIKLNELKQQRDKKLKNRK